MKQFVYSPKSLGVVIRRQRKKKKLSQSEAGELYHLEQSTISSIERGAAGTRLDTLFRLLAALDLEVIISDKENHAGNLTEEWE